MTVLEPQLREQLQKALDEINRCLAASTKSRDLVEHLLGSAGAAAKPAVVAESGRPGRPELLAKKGRIVGGVGCPPNCRTSGKLRGSSGKLRGSSDPFELFRKMLHFGKIPKKIGEI